MDEKSKNKTGIVVFIVVLIVLVVAIGVYFYISNQSEEDIILQGQTENVETNEPENFVEPENNVQETQLSINSEMVEELVEKIVFPTYATASIYHAGNFDLNTIPNDLILRLGWSKIDYEDRNTNLNKQTVSSETMKESIENSKGPLVTKNGK